MPFIDAIRRILPRNRFARNVSVLMGGTAAGQAILVLASPLLTRLYSPQDLGLLAVYGGLLMIIASIASLRYQIAIPLPARDDEAALIVVLSLVVVLAASALTALGTLFLGDFIVGSLGSPGLGRYLWLLPVGVLMVGVFEVLNYWAIRVRAFTPIAQAKLAQSFTMVAVQLGGHGLGALALLLGQAAGHAAAATRLGLLVARSRRTKFSVVSPEGVIAVARRYRRFPIYSTWGAVFNTVGTQLPPVMFAALFSPAAAGLYLLAHRVLAMPLSLLGRAVADVFFVNAAEAERSHQLAPLVAMAHDRLAQIGMPPTFALILAGPDIFALVFGPEWRQAGEFSRWMAPWLYFVLVASPLSSLSSVLWKQAQEMVFQVVLLATRVGALLFAARSGGMMLAVALFSLVSAACLVVFLLWVILASGNSTYVFLRSSLRAFTWSAVLVAPLGLTYVFSGGHSIWFAMLALSGLLIAGRCLFLLKEAWSGGKQAVV